MSDPATRITLEFDDLASLQQELEGNLRQGGAFAPGETSLAERSRCELVLVHPQGKPDLVLACEVVFVKRDGADCGAGLQLLDFSDELVRRLEEFAGERALARKKVASVNERVRGLSAAERQKLARTGGYAERLALERAFSKDIWEGLLQNPRLTPPEVARIARMGTLPGPQVEAIATNPGFLTSGPVRRALLSNPRLTGALIEHVLRAFPRAERVQIAKQTCFPIKVRNAARKLIP